MTQKDKNLLLKDLCARLSYGIKCHYNSSEIDDDEEEGDATIVGINKIYELVDIDICEISIEDIKPYLRPMSSMTDEECKEVGEHITIYDTVDWMNEHHFDYHGLIEKGLALEAPEGMYKIE